MDAFNPIRSALISQLLTVVDLPEVAWENRSYDAVINTPYVQPFVSFSTPTQSTLGTDGRNEIRGFMQLTLVYPIDNGNGDTNDMAAAILEKFKRGTLLTYGGVDVKCTHSYPSLAIQDGDWFRTPLTINFYSITEN